MTVQSTAITLIELSDLSWLDMSTEQHDAFAEFLRTADPIDLYLLIRFLNSKRELVSRRDRLRLNELLVESIYGHAEKNPKG